KALYDYMRDKGLEALSASTQIIIAPGYTIKSCDILITNFHQPRSTLLLLVAAAVGESWKSIYQYALENDFRFLSYGDSSILFVNK
ncbi:MAG: S-adenosylmethionine:tRNA ribosyltransferase-isomerase, partial [Tenuifilum sp.]